MNIITKEEQEKFLKWISDNTHRFEINQASKNRKYISLDNIEPKEKITLFDEVKKRILEEENITNWIPDPFFGDIITFNDTGASIHIHIDQTLPNRQHIRFNLFLSKPESGGDPIYMNKKLPFEERQYLKYHVNKHYHSSLPVKGSKPRIVISYGISIPE